MSNNDNTTEGVILNSTVNSIGMLHDVAGENAAKALNSPLLKVGQKFGLVGQVVTAPASFVIETQLNGLSGDQATVKITGGAVGSGGGGAAGAWAGAKVGGGIGTLLAGPPGAALGAGIGAAIGFVGGSHIGNYLGGEASLGVYDNFPDIATFTSEAVGQIQEVGSAFIGHLADGSTWVSYFDENNQQQTHDVTQPPVPLGLPENVLKPNESVIWVKLVQEDNLGNKLTYDVDGQSGNITKVEVDLESEAANSSNTNELVKALKDSNVSHKIGDGAEFTTKDINSNEVTKKYTSSDTSEIIESEGTKVANITGIETLIDNGQNIGQVVDTNSQVTLEDGSTHDTFDFLDMLLKRSDLLAEFTQNAFSEYVKFADGQAYFDTTPLMAEVTTRLLSGEDLEAIAEDIASELLVTGGVGTLFDNIASGLPEDWADLGGKSQSALVKQAVIDFAVSTLVYNEDADVAARDAVTQQIVNGTLQSNIFDDLFTQTNAAGTTTLNLAGAAVSAAVVSLATAMFSGDDIGEQQIGAASIAAGQAAIYSAFTGAAEITLFSSNLGFLSNPFTFTFDPASFAISVAVSIIVSELLTSSKTYHDETVSHKVEEQADGSLLITGLREAGSLLRTSTTDDDVMGNDGGHDVIVGQSGQNELYGQGGDDFIEGRDNEDYIEGGNGDDHIEAGNQNDYADGGAGNDRVYGGAGDDNLLGGVGDDIVLGGIGNDNIEGNAGFDHLIGGAGHDTLLGGDEDDFLNGGDGDDVLSGEAGFDFLLGGNGNDTLRGDGEDDELYGGDGNDDIRGGDGDDSLFGQNDVDQLYGGAGNDIIDGGKDADIAFGGIGDDLLYGNFANDALYGEIGSDLLIGGGGRDTLDGGAGNDVYLYNRKDGIDTITDTDGVNTLKFEDLNAADIASINQVGNDLVLTIDSLNSITVTDQFTTLGLADIEFADGQRIEISNMTFDGAGVGSYTLVAGTNILSTVANQYGYYNQITMPFNAGTALSTDWLLNNYDTNVTTDAYEAEIYNDVQVRTWTKTAGFFGMRFSMGYYDYHERFLEGSGSADRVVGLWWDENIEGFSNNDQLYGNNGNDTILGGIDHDLIYGGSGDDTLNGEIGADQIFGGTGNDIIYGGDGNDTFYGEWGNDNLNGDGGDDYLSGGTGTDTLNGGTGRDLLYGDEGDDNLFGGLEDDFLSGGSGTDTLRGEAGRDLLFGGEGDDDLQGGDGDDTLIGVEGNDALDGGDGTDMAVFGGKLADYNVTVDVNGTATVTDLRANSLDGADTLSNVETLQFFDQMVDLTSQAVQIRDIILPQNTTFNGQVVIPSGYTLSLEQGTDRGVVTLDADGSYSYTSSEFAGQTSFQYKLIDAQGITTVSKVNVFVAPSAADMNAYAHGTEENVSTGTFVDASSMDYRSQTTALSNGGHVVVWRAKSETNTSELNLYYRVYNAAGVATTASLLAPAVEAGIESYGHVSALNDGGFLLSWYENDGKAKWRSFDADGNATTGDISFIDPALSQGNHTATGAHIVELNSGNLGGVWVADNQLYFGEFNTAGNRVGTATVITSVDVEAARYLDVTKLTSGSLAITWQKELASHPHDADVRTAIVSESGVLIGNIQDVYADVDGGSFSDPRYQQTPHVAALNDGGYVVVFTSSHTYSENNVYFMRYDVSGDAVTASPVLVNDASISGEQFANGVTALADGGFMVMWDINGSYQLYARRYDAAGNSVGNEFKIHDTAINNQPWSDITSLSNGDLIATWTRNDAGNFEIVQKRFIPNDTYLSILGDSGAEDIVADNSADVITASDGDDTIVGGSGDDVIDGGAGTDTAYFDSRLSDYTISIADETVTVTDNRGATSSASTIFSRENFEETVTGWSDNMTTDGGASFTNFLGRFGSGQLIEKTFNVSSYADEVVVSFDFYQIDSWDWDERFQVLVDDTLIFSEQFLAGDDEAAQSGQAGNVSWSIEPLTPPGQLGFQSGSGEYWWQDQKHQITLTIENPNESFKLGLTSTLNQAIGDESFGIDNVTMDAKRYGNIIASEDFEGVVTGWSDNTTTDGGTGLSTFLGRFASGAITEKTFEISPNAAEVVVSFDFYQIDSWDWPEEFQVLVDDVLILSENFLASENEAGRSGQTGDVSWSIDPLSDPEHLGFKYGSGESWNQDQKHRVTLVIANPSSSFKLGFTSTLDQNIYDESFGIDNLQITAHIPDGTDTLSNVENLAFTDQTIQWAGLFNDLNDIVIGQGTAYNGQIELQVGDVAGLAQAATHGTVTVNTNGTYSYTAPASYLGDDSFVYSVTTSTGIQRTVTVNITVANNLSGTDAGEILVSSSGNDILNGTDGTDTAAFSGDFADYSLLFNGDILTVTDNRTGSPDGTDTLLNIENAQFADQTVSVSNLFSDMPNFITPQGETLMGQIDLPAGHTLSLVSAPSQGTLVLNADGSYQYDAPANFAGTLSFTYQMTTPNGIVKQQTSDIDVLALTSSAAAYTHGTEENVSTGTFVDASSMDYRSQTTALSNGGHVVVWRARNEINTNELNFYYRVYNAAGVATTAALLAPAVEAGIESYGHVSALNDGGFLLSWYENDGKAKWRGFDADGNATTGDISFIDPALSQGNHTATGAHIIELHSGNLGGVWVADNQLYFGEFDTAGNRVGAATVITSVDVEAARDLDVTKLTDGSLAVTWQKELYALPYDSDVRTAVISDTGALIGSVQDVYPDADGGSISAPRYQQMSYVAALNNGSYVVAFTSSHTYSENNIYFMRYDSSGNALTTSPVLVNDASISGQQFANGITALADGGFMVTWDVDGAFGLYGRRYDSVGNSVGNEFQIHDTAINNQPWSDITSLSNGDLIATWTRNDAGNFEVVQKKLIAPPPEGVAVTGDSSDEVLLGSAADDVLNGGVGNDTLQGQAGDDTLSGGLGDDIYLFGTGDGSDTVSNQDFAGTDIVKFGTGIERQDIWFEQDGLDLRALLHESDDQIIFENWFSSDEQKVDQFQLEDGYQLNTAQVSELVETMSNYDPIALGTISTIADLPDEVENIVISSWVM